ncbi:unnamed protein product [Onchocerca flexuosa]|uniref:BRCT domain-containing protein n=1 Tax=Onchocerca flexuosa TaxID=387005 RepID=A0A183H2D8_9BILA|nr:unnamed protein product [Onchocerca flexuosa]
MPVKGQVFIDMKTRITSYGPHNGIIVHCGIQQEPDKSWPYIRNDAANTLSSQPFDVAPPVPATVHWPTVEDSNDNRSDAKTCRSRIPNQYYPLIVADGTSSDNFNLIDRLNVFETVRFAFTFSEFSHHSLSKLALCHKIANVEIFWLLWNFITEDAMNKKVLMNPISISDKCYNPVLAELRSLDTGSISDGNYKSNSSGTVSKISKNDVSKRLSTNAQNVDVSHWTAPSTKKAVKKEVSNQIMRLQSVAHSRKDEQCTSVIQINSNFTPMKQSLKKQQQIANIKYDYNQIEKESARDHPFLEEISLVKNDPEIIGESTNGCAVHQQKIIRRGFSEHLAGLSTYTSNQQYQQCKSIPDLCQVQSNHREVPEQLYHLYETQDAFGNPLAQLEMEAEMNEQILSPLSSLDISKNLNTDHDEHDKNLMKNFGLPLILEHFSPESRLESGNHTKQPLECLQQYSQPSIDIFNDVDILRNACASQCVRSVIPISLNKMQESVVHIPDEIKNLNFISADETKNILKKTASEYSEVFPTKIPSTTNSGQLKVTAERRSEKQLMEKEGNLENIFEKLKSCDMDTEKNTELQKLDNTRSAITTSLKPILHMSTRKSSLSKKVRFPAERPQVIALDHRLFLIGDLDSI